MISIACPWCKRSVEAEGFSKDDFPSPSGGWPYKDCRCPKCGQSFRAQAMCGCRVKAIPIIDQPKFTYPSSTEGKGHELQR